MIKIAINGFGRIGRLVFKQTIDNGLDLDIVAINDLTEPKVLAHLLKYDSVYKMYDKKIESTEDSIIIDEKEIKIFKEKDPLNLPWRDLSVDVVLECTGIFRKYEDAKKHIEAGAKKVIISAPGKSPEIKSYILGINAEDFDVEKDEVMDMGSCTTNCLAPIAKVLNDNFKIVNGFMTTIHSYTSDQKILDLPHKDLRRARAAALNIIPTTTGATKAIGKVIPELEGKLNGIAMRVPTPTVSVVDLVCELEKNPTAEEVNGAFKDASKQDIFKGILDVEETSLVSSDYVGNSFSSIVDAGLTMAQNNLVKVVSWYDNEFGYATRMAEFAEFIGKKL